MFEDGILTQIILRVHVDFAIFVASLKIKKEEKMTIPM
jgi:hypothetical protein